MNAAKIREPVDLATAPKTRPVEVWYVTFAYWTSDGWRPGISSVSYESRAEAEEIADIKRRAGDACVRATGPHQQRVPA